MDSRSIGARLQAILAHLGLPPVSDQDSGRFAKIAQKCSTVGRKKEQIISSLLGKSG